MTYRSSLTQTSSLQFGLFYSVLNQDLSDLAAATVLCVHWYMVQRGLFFPLRRFDFKGAG